MDDLEKKTKDKQVKIMQQENSNYMTYLIETHTIDRIASAITTGIILGAMLLQTYGIISPPEYFGSEQSRAVYELAAGVTDNAGIGSTIDVKF